jgi:type IV pilus assembly protein PilQ
MSIDVKDTDIRDVIRMISTGYNLSIIIDKEVSGKVTLHLSGVPIMEGLSKLAESAGLEVVKEGSVYNVRKKSEEQRSVIQYIRNKLTVDVQNMDVRDFLKEISSKTAISIVPDAKVEGKISGKLYDVNLEDGLRALLEGNGFSVTKRKNIYNVTSGDNQAGQPQGMISPRRMGGATGTGRSSFNVEYNDGRLSLDVSNGDLEDVVKAIAEQSGIQIVTYGSIRAEINAKLDNIPLTEALALLLGGTNYTFIQKDSIILIGDRNPASQSGQALSKSEMIHLKYIKADIVPQILPKVNNIKVVKEQNALLITGTSEDIVNTREVIATIDIPTPQVIIDVLVVEYSRGIGQDYGLSFGADTARVWNSFEYPHLRMSRDKQGVINTIGFNSNEWIKVLQQLPNNFYLNLHLMEEQKKAKVLAQPSITVLNGNKANIDVSTTEYYKIVTGINETQNLQFRPITFGISMQITPWISRGGQITAEISPDISNSAGYSKDNYPSVFKRSVSTTVRLNNNQTVVLGGLIRSDVNIQNDKVPFFGDIPLLGYLFRTQTKSNQQTNLVIYITPHIVQDSAYIDLDRELQELDKKQNEFYMHDESFLEAYKRARVYGAEQKAGAGKSSAPASDSSAASSMSDSDSTAR